MPLPAEIVGAVSNFESSFGYPIDFICECITDSLTDCACSQEKVMGFWSRASHFMLEYVTLSLDGVSMESLRKSFVEFHIDFPDTTSLAVKSIRAGLIADANRVYHRLSGTSNDLPWPDASSPDLFSSDVSVLSILRSVIDQRTARPSEPVDVSLLLEGHSGLFVLQLASVLDQLNLIDVSAQILTYYKNHEHYFSNHIKDQIVCRINQTICSRNLMKNLFFSKTIKPSSPKEMIPAGLDAFRLKLGRMMAAKKSIQKSEKEEDEGNTSPMAVYWKARRSGSRTVDSPVREIPFLAEHLHADSSIGVQTNDDLKQREVVEKKRVFMPKKVSEMSPEKKETQLTTGSNEIVPDIAFEDVSSTITAVDTESVRIDSSYIIVKTFRHIEDAKKKYEAWEKDAEDDLAKLCNTN